jgi:putative ABC transport system permease protein
VLLVCGGLLFRSVENLLRVDIGFQPQHALLFDLFLPNSRYPDAAAQTRFYRDLMRELGQTPGITAAGGLLYFPQRPKLWLSSIWREDTPVAEGDEPVVYFNLIAGDYFQAMAIPLKAGRLPTAREMWDERRVIVVNESFARHVYPGRDAIGRRIRTDKGQPWLDIIGIVGDVRQKRLDDPPKPEVYTTYAAMPMPFLTVVTRTSGAPERTQDVVRSVVHRADAGLAIANLTSLDEYVGARVADRRFALSLLGLFALLAVGLGAMGIYGVMSYSVAQRRREIAIRLALGAEPGGVRAMVVRDGLGIVVAGTMGGLLAAAIAGRLMRGLLFGVGGFDVLTYLSVPLALLSVAALAAWLPARRASRVDAMTTLRGE